MMAENEDRQRAATYFQTTRVPKWAKDRQEQVMEFLEYHRIVGKCVAVVTSGGTTVPLEQNTVRFLDNFSTGSRGAASVEYLLDLGYAVIYIHRPGSVAPFARHLQKATSSHVDLKLLDHVDIRHSAQDVQLSFHDYREKKKVTDAVQKFKETLENNGLLAIPFTSVDDYFFLLKMVAECVSPWKERALFYLAAAVSDFYIPQQEISEHKIQSRSGPLMLSLQQVPKLLGLLRRDWAPNAFIVSFKLETDWEILRQKAKQAIDKYAMHLVVANELHSRFNEVLLITAKEERLIEKHKDVEDIESPLIDAVAGMHFKFIASQDVSVPDDVGHRIPGGHRRLRRKLPQPMQKALSVVEDHKEEILAVVLGGLLSVMLNMLQNHMRRR